MTVVNQGSVWLRGEMEWDGPDSVFWNRMVPISVWLVEWDDPCFLFGWKDKVRQSDPVSCLDEGIEIGYLHMITSLIM